LSSGLTCPDCHGALWEIKDGATLKYRCRVGHAYSTETIVRAQHDATERALWAARRALEERAALLERLAGDSRSRRPDRVAARFDERAAAAREDAHRVQETILHGRSLDPVTER